MERDPVSFRQDKCKLDFFWRESTSWVLWSTGKILSLVNEDIEPMLVYDPGQNLSFQCWVWLCFGFVNCLFRVRISLCVNSGRL